MIGSLAIANAFRTRGAKILFVVNNNRETLQAIKENMYSVATAKNGDEECLALKSFRPDVIVVNQLNNPLAYLKKLKKHASLLVTIDDAGKGARVADIRFNPLYYAGEAFCGPEFATLRKEFKKTRKKCRVKKKATNILVTLGGSDTYGFTPKVVSALNKFPKDVSITVLLGPAFRHEKELEKVLGNAGWSFVIARDVSAKEMVSIIAKADVAVCSAGNTLYEVAHLGTPAVIVCGEPFEEETARWVAERGFGVNLGFGKNLETRHIFKAVADLMRDYKLRLRMSKKGKKLVNGKGAGRIVEIITRKLDENSRSTVHKNK